MLAQLVERNDGIVEVSGSIPLHSMNNWFCIQGLRLKFIRSHLLFFILFALGFYASARFCHKQTGGFTVWKIASDHSFHPEWDVESLDPKNQAEVDLLLNQPYHFYSYGGQSYIFISADGTTVLKVFKHHHMRSFSWIDHVPLPRNFHMILKQFTQSQRDKLSHFFGSCTLAYDLFKERTGLIYLHLNKTSHFKRTLTLIDKLNIAHQIDLDHTDFALQKKAELPYERFRRLKKEGNLAEAERSLKSLLELIAERCQRGIEDRDPNIRRNCGFLKGKAIEIDLGSYSRNEALKNPKIGRETLLRQTRRLEQWIVKTYPELHPCFQKQLHEVMNHL